ncbi:MAG: acetylxylan esterase [candidate division KSB1 bacterium]|nr:acetylxylan esterase [candidate division KSB1 bacterium]
MRHFLFVSALCISFQAFAQIPDFPPPDVTARMDRDQMLQQLGIVLPELPPKLQDPNAPRNARPADPNNPEGNWTDDAGHTVTRSVFGLWNNYDDREEGFFPGPESWRVGNYPPLDLLKSKDGRLIRTAEEWIKIRRPEVLKDVQEQVWGTPPPDSILPQVRWSVETERIEAGDHFFIEKRITGEIDVSCYPQVRNVPVIKAVLRIPEEAPKPAPVMVIIGHPRWTPVGVYAERGRPYGWGMCIFDCLSLQPDDGAGLTSYLIGLCNRGRWRKPEDWGALAAWGWGVSRLLDYFAQDPEVDETRVGVSGHSRWGKAALVTMAYDPRIAIAFPSCAGSLGTKMNRRHWGQDLENSAWEREYHWTAGNFFKWMGPLREGSYLPRKIELCPVDAHFLLALCAPRPVFFNAGTQDTWTDPYGIYLTMVAASPVWELFGYRGLVMPDEKPQFDKAYIDGRLGYRCHIGGHIDAPDWPAFFEFAERELKKR